MRTQTFPRKEKIRCYFWRIIINNQKIKKANFNNVCLIFNESESKYKVSRIKY